MPDRTIPLTDSAGHMPAEAGPAGAGDWAGALKRSGYGQVDHVAVTGSTNADLLAPPLGQSPARPALRWADHQDAGRGRRGRQWVDVPGQALMLSMAFERSGRGTDAGAPLAAFSLVAGLTVARSLQASGLAAAPLRLKWPNDVLMAGRKVAGILVELRQHGDLQRLVVGCGINLLEPPAAALGIARDSGLPAGGLLGPGPREATVTSLSVRQTLVAQIAVRMAAAHHEFFKSGLSAFLPGWMACHAYQDEPIMLMDGSCLLAQGVCRGVDKTGSLLVETDAGVQAFVIGEVSARPVGAKT